MPDIRSLPEAVQELLLHRLDSIAQLEVLLLLHRTAPEAWDAARVAGELRIDPAWAAEQLALLRDRQLLRESSASGSYHFAAATPELAKAVEALAASYTDRRVAIVALLYSRPAPGIRVFADAFRIRKEHGDG